MPFADSLAECVALVRAGRFYAGLVLAQAIVEAAVLLVWRVKVRRRKNQSADFAKALEALQVHSLINGTSKATAEALWAERDALLLRKSREDSDSQLLEEAARSCLALADGIAGHFFSYTERDGAVIPDHSEYWSAVDEARPTPVGG